MALGIEAIRLNPKLALAYYNRGLAYRAKGDLDRAIADYSEAIRLDPKDADAYSLRSLAYLYSALLPKALADSSRQANSIRKAPTRLCGSTSSGNATARQAVCGKPPRSST